MATSRAHQRMFHGHELPPTKGLVVIGVRELRAQAVELSDRNLSAECRACIAALAHIGDDVLLHHDDAQVRGTVDALCCSNRLTFITRNATSAHPSLTRRTPRQCARAHP